MRQTLRPLPMLLCAVLLPVAGCKLLDQRTFDRHADVKPVPPLPPPGPLPHVVPPLATIRFPGAPESWTPALADIVHRALAAKPDVLFTVQTVVPVTGNPQDQATAMSTAVHHDGQAVAQAIQDAGAPASQIDMTTIADQVAGPEVRVTAR